MCVQRSVEGDVDGEREEIGNSAEESERIMFSIGMRSNS